MWRIVQVLFGVLAASPLMAAPRWVQVSPGSGVLPPGRTNAAAIYDPVGHRLVVFGGRSSAGDHNDVWALDLQANEWTELTPSSSTGPAPRFTANAIYDPAGHQMVLWSGQGGGLFHNDVWAFDLDSYEWRMFTPPEPRPNIRYGAASIFDPVERDLVTFAGFTDQGRFEDTWRFDIDREIWQAVDPGELDPGRRCLHSAAYDSSGHRMIIYGGQRTGALGDIWALDLADNSWSDLTPAARPAGRYFTAQAYDSTDHQVIIFGGNLGGSRTDEVWAFSLQAGSWELLAPAGTAPTARDGSAAVFIAQENRVLVFGGFDGAYRNDVWSLEGLIASVSECIAGNVNAAEGPISNVLYVNESVGQGEERTVRLSLDTALELRLDAPISLSGRPAPFVLYAWIGSPNAATVQMLPYNLGPICMPVPLSGGGAPQPAVIWNNIGLEVLLGAPSLGSQPAPSVVLDLTQGLGFGGTFFLQGIILDTAAQNGIAAVTNGITLVVE